MTKNMMMNTAMVFSLVYLPLNTRYNLTKKKSAEALSLSFFSVIHPNENYDDCYDEEKHDVPLEE